MELSGTTGQPVFVTLSEQGMVAARGSESAQVEGVPSPGAFVIVGAGDAVTANLASALAVGASLRETLELASLAASIVIHQLGTTGTAGPEQMLELLRNSALVEP